MQKKITPERVLIYERQSGIELLKIIAMLMVTVFHCEMSLIEEESPLLLFFDISSPSSDPSFIILQMTYYFGALGNLVFLICSSWFLADRGRVRKEKTAGIIIDVWIFSVTFLVIFSACGKELTFNETVTSFIPITSGNNWYITCYILLYLLHPYLNKMMESITQKQHLSLAVAVFSVNFIINSIYEISLYFNGLLCFMAVYVIVGYIKKYAQSMVTDVSFNRLCLIGCTVLVIFFQLALNFLGLKYGKEDSAVFLYYFAVIQNPLLLIMAFALFNLFSAMKFKNKFVNYLSSLSLIIYIVHQNILFRRYVRPALMFDAWKYFTDMDICVLVLIFSAAMFIVSALAAAVYGKLLQPLCHKLAEKVMNFILKQYGKFEALLMKM